MNRIKRFAKGAAALCALLLLIANFQNCAPGSFQSQSFDSASTSQGSGEQGTSPSPQPGVQPQPQTPQLPVPNPTPGPNPNPTPVVTYNLNVAKSGSGIVVSNLTGINCGSDCSEAYPDKTNVTLTATPNQGFVFKGWGGACGGTNLTCTLAMTEVRNVLVNFESSSGNPATVDAVISAMPSNSWKALAGTMMKDVCPLPYNHYLCEAVVAAWSGGAYDNSKDRMVIIGGGHLDSYYNNVFTFDLTAMKWYRLSEMASHITGEEASNWYDRATESCGFYLKKDQKVDPSNIGSNGYVPFEKCFIEPVISQIDLQQPRSSHTYNGVFVEPMSGRYCYMGGTFYPSAQAGTRTTSCFDSVTGVWSRVADIPADKPIFARGSTASDASGNTWVFAGEGGYMGRYNPLSNTWTTFGYQNYDSNGGMDIDRKRNHAYVLHPEGGGAYSLEKWDLGSTAALNANSFTKEVTTGSKPINLGPSPGLAYVESMDKLFAWGGGKTIYIYDIPTKVWTQVTPGGDDPGVQTQWGTFGRFRYSAKKGVFVLVNSTEQNVFIYKP